MFIRIIIWCILIECKRLLGRGGGMSSTEWHVYLKRVPHYVYFLGVFKPFWGSVTIYFFYTQCSLCLKSDSRSNSEPVRSSGSKLSCQSALEQKQNQTLTCQTSLRVSTHQNYLAAANRKHVEADSGVVFENTRWHPPAGLSQTGLGCIMRSHIRPHYGLFGITCTFNRGLTSLWSWATDTWPLTPEAEREVNVMKRNISVTLVGSERNTMCVSNPARKSDLFQLI